MFRTVILISIWFLFFINSKSYSDILNSSDLMPIENNINFIEASFNFGKASIFDSDYNNTYNTISGFEKQFSKIGFLYTEPLNLGFQLSDFEYNYKKIPQPELSNLSLKNLTLLYLPDFTLLNSKNTKLYFKFDYLKSNKSSFQCLEFDNNIVGVSKLKCDKNNKVFIQSNLPEDHEKTIGYNVDSIGFEIGVRKQKTSWKKKQTFQYGLSSKKINYDIKFGNNLANYPKSYISYFPQQEPLIENALKIKYNQAFLINDSWSFGVGLSTYLLGYFNNKNKKHPYSETGKNIALEIKLLRKFRDKFYLSFDGLMTSDHLMGIETDYGLFSRSNLEKTKYNEISINIGLFNNFESNKKESDFEPLKNFDISSIISKTKVTENKLDNSENKSIAKDNSENKSIAKDNLSLIKYALEFATNFDDQKIVF